ncbi:hypothetical protein Mapa_000421 [Marchantia paleacea]|nr:hypothetical protein Mapa_000421 [Marchantia paleacea]
MEMKKFLVVLVVLQMLLLGSMTSGVSAASCSSLVEDVTSHCSEGTGFDCCNNAAELSDSCSSDDLCSALQAADAVDNVVNGCGLAADC